MGTRDIKRGEVSGGLVEDDRLKYLPVAYISTTSPDQRKPHPNTHFRK
jgi:hypothetical protein